MTSPNHHKDTKVGLKERQKMGKGASLKHYRYTKAILQVAFLPASMLLLSLLKQLFWCLYPAISEAALWLKPVMSDFKLSFSHIPNFMIPVYVHRDNVYMQEQSNYASELIQSIKSSKSGTGSTIWSVKSSNSATGTQLPSSSDDVLIFLFESSRKEICPPSILLTITTSYLDRWATSIFFTIKLKN